MSRQERGRLLRCFTNQLSVQMMGDEMIVFGGFGGSKWYDELVCLNTNDMEWHRPELENKTKAQTPPPRYAHSAVSVCVIVCVCVCAFVHAYVRVCARQGVG